MKRQFLSFTLLLALSTWIAQAATVRGTVSDTAGKPLQGVVVTDGYNFTQTNERGEYSLDSNLDKSRFVYLSVPGDYEIEQTKGIPDLFYQQLDKSKEINEHDFTLTPRKQPIDGFVYLAISDPQTIDERQMKRFREETIPDLKQTIERYQGKEVYGMALGDITWDRMDLFTPYKEAVSVLGIPMFLRDRQSRPRLTLPGLIQSKGNRGELCGAYLRGSFRPLQLFVQCRGCTYHHLKRY